MKAAVRYYSKSGNTKKLAEAIAKGVGTTAETIDETLSKPVELLFLGGAVYAGNISRHLKNFIQQLTSEKVKMIAVFSTSASGKPIQMQIAQLLKDKEIKIIGEEFACKGKFLIANRGRPNEQDCRDAAEFAKKLLGNQ